MPFLNVIAGFILIFEKQYQIWFSFLEFFQLFSNFSITLPAKSLESLD